MSLYANGWREPIPGPRIEQLRSDLRGGDRDAVLTAFWDEVEATGAPLVAPIPGDPDASAVTFLWRDLDGDLDHVVLGGSLVLHDHAQNLLRRVPGTDVLALTLRLPKETRTSYSLGVGVPLAGIHEAVMPWMARGGGETTGSWVGDPLNRAPRIADAIVLDLAPDSDPEWTAWLSLEPPAPPVEHRILSAALRAERTYWVHLPEGPIENVVWSFDGRGWSSGPGALQIFTEGLTATDRIGPTAVVFIDSPPERRQQDVLFDGPFADYIRDELVPDVRRRYDLPSDPAVNVISGYSGGGGAAAFLALRAPQVFGRSIVGAGSVAWTPYGGGALRQLYDWYRADPPRDARFALTVGDLELDRILDIPSLYDATVEFAAVLDELGIRSTVYTGPHGHDMFCSRLLLARALPDLLAS
jgi:enterochelin esterase family protein